MHMLVEQERLRLAFRSAEFWDLTAVLSLPSNKRKLIKCLLTSVDAVRSE